MRQRAVAALMGGDNFDPPTPVLSLAASRQTTYMQTRLRPWQHPTEETWKQPTEGGREKQKSTLQQQAASTNYCSSGGQMGDVLRLALSPLFIPQPTKPLLFQNKKWTASLSPHLTIPIERETGNYRGHNRHAPISISLSLSFSQQATKLGRPPPRIALISPSHLRS